MIQLHAKTYTGLPRASVSYEVKLLHSFIFFILYDEDGERSVTNDATAVIEDLLFVFCGVKSAIIIYKDLEGVYDFIVPDLDSDNVSLKCIGALSEEAAVNWWLRRNTDILSNKKIYHE